MCRLIAIGDIHGCDTALAKILDAIAPETSDTIIQLGDIVDRGPSSSQVLDRLIQLSENCKFVCLAGDHEDLMLAALADHEQLPRWFENGGVATMNSYGWSFNTQQSIDSFIPESHVSFLKNCVAFHETGKHIFVHAGYVPNLSMNEQPDLALKWRVSNRSTQPHASGKTVVVGHTPQRSGLILDMGYLKCIDTNCYRGGWLTAIELNTGRAWQSNQAHELRSHPGPPK